MSSVAARLAAADPCGYFRNAGIATFVRHLGETRCHRCLALFAELRRASLLEDTTSEEPPTQAASPSEALSHHSVPSERSVDHWLAYEYSLIPLRDRPLAGSNDWFRWLDDFEGRHPLEVSRLDQPLASRAHQVLWNSY
jgi:hypothetical protein